MTNIAVTQKNSIRSSDSDAGTSARFSKLTWHKKLSGQQQLSGTEYRVLMVFFDHADSNGHRAFPSLEDVQGEACVSESTAKRAIRTLIELGWLVRTQRGGKRNGKKFANVYSLGVPPTWEPYIPAKYRQELEQSPENRVTGDAEIKKQGHTRPPNRSSRTSDPSRYSGQRSRPSEDNPSDPYPEQPGLDEWKIKNRHREEAQRLGLDISLVEIKFRQQMSSENRSCWDSTFWQYLTATSRGREDDEFPPGIYDFAAGIQPP